MRLGQNGHAHVSTAHACGSINTEEVQQEGLFCTACALHKVVDIYSLTSQYMLHISFTITA